MSSRATPSRRPPREAARGHSCAGRGAVRYPPNSWAAVVLPPVPGPANSLVGVDRVGDVSKVGDVEAAEASPNSRRAWAAALSREPRPNSAPWRVARFVRRTARVRVVACPVLALWRPGGAATAVASGPDGFAAVWRRAG